MSRLIFLVVLIMAVAGVIAVQSSTGDNRALVNQGAYLVNRASLCIDCHSAQKPDGTTDDKKLLSGAPILFRPTVTMPWAEHAPNLTPGGLLKPWTNAALVKFLMTGIDPSGERADPPMPQYRFGQRDAEAVAAYLRHLPAIKSDPTGGAHQHEHE